MGDRVNVRFVNGSEKSVWLYWHWGGTQPAEEAVRWVKSLGPYDPAPKNQYGGSCSDPDSRRDADHMVVRFLKDTPNEPDRITEKPLGPDNGSWEVDLRTGGAINVDEDSITAQLFEGADQ